MENYNQKKWRELHTQNRYHPKYPVEEVVQFIFRNFKRDGQEKVLDMGCGAGRHVMLMANENIIPYGIDYSDTGVDYTRSVLAKSGYDNYVENIQTSPCMNLPYEDFFFDGILNIGVLYYLSKPEIESAVSEMYRVCKPGARICVLVRSTNDYRYREAADNTAMIDEQDESKCAFSENGMSMHFFTKEEIQELFKDWKDLEIDRIIQTHENESYADDNFWITATR